MTRLVAFLFLVVLVQAIHSRFRIRALERRVRVLEQRAQNQAE